MFNLTGSIVLYNNDEQVVRKAIESFLASPLSGRLFLIDNSETRRLSVLADDERIEYVFTGSNLGYGKAHNIAMKAIFGKSVYHLVLNPDVEFPAGTLEAIFEFMEKHQDIGQVLPKILYRDGSLQRLCKLLPTPMDLIGRRFLPGFMMKRRNREYELHDFGYDNMLHLANLSGCFMFLRMGIMESIGLFDERFFMYLEDVDLTRRINVVAGTVFFPQVFIYHGFEKESYANPRLLLFHIVSAIKYFNKWGWIFDKRRKQINKQVLDEIRR